jgi:single-strand DNA-binding protein
MLNKVTLIGNLGKDPVFRVTANNSPVAEFSLATTESWKDGNERVSHTEWHKVVVWGKLAQAVRDGLHKGSKTYIEGSLRTRKWTDKDGIDRYTTEVNASRVLFLDPRRRDQDNADLADDNSIQF